jgi:hypothetical protein
LREKMLPERPCCRRSRTLQPQHLERGAGKLRVNCLSSHFGTEAHVQMPCHPWGLVSPVDVLNVILSKQNLQTQLDIDLV